MKQIFMLLPYYFETFYKLLYSMQYTSLVQRRQQTNSPQTGGVKPRGSGNSMVKPRANIPKATSDTGNFNKRELNKENWNSESFIKNFSKSTQKKTLYWH